ncbi:MAG: hypothetical protein LKM35_00840 [Lachnospiraceae bacterium]|jgi:hypothetical protein|nr:hypothetical protein [Lachnospiraceae bacterium]
MDNLPNTNMKGACSMSPSGLFCGVVDSGDVISIFDVKAEEKKASITSAVLSQDGENADSESLPIEGFAMISDTQFVLVTEEEAACIDFLTASPVWERKFTAEEANSYVAGLCFAVNQDASRLAISGPTMMDSFLVLDTATGEILTEKTSLSDASNASDAFITKLVINPSGNRFAFGITRILSASSVPGLTVYDLTEDRFTEAESCRTNIAEMVFADDDRLMTMEYSKTSDSTSGTSQGHRRARPIPPQTRTAHPRIRFIPEHPASAATIPLPGRKHGGRRGRPLTCRRIIPASGFFRWKGTRKMTAPFSAVRTTTASS